MASFKKIAKKASKALLKVLPFIAPINTDVSGQDAQKQPEQQVNDSEVRQQVEQLKSQFNEFDKFEKHINKAKIGEDEKEKLKGIFENTKEVLKEYSANLDNVSKGIEKAENTKDAEKGIEILEKNKVSKDVLSRLKKVKESAESVKGKLQSNDAKKYAILITKTLDIMYDSLLQTHNIWNSIHKDLEKKAAKQEINEESENLIEMVKKDLKSNDLGHIESLFDHLEKQRKKNHPFLHTEEQKEKIKKYFEIRPSRRYKLGLVSLYKNSKKERIEIQDEHGKTKKVEGIQFKEGTRKVKLVKLHDTIAMYLGYGLFLDVMDINALKKPGKNKCFMEFNGNKVTDFENDERFVAIGQKKIPVTEARNTIIHHIGRCLESARGTFGIKSGLHMKDINYCKNISFKISKGIDGTLHNAER